MLITVAIAAANFTACKTSKTAASSKTKVEKSAISDALMRMLGGGWEMVGVTMDGKTLPLPTKEQAEISFNKDKMMLSALGRKESTPFMITKNKDIVAAENPTDRPMHIASLTRTDLVLTFNGSNGKPIEMTFLHKN